MALTYERVDDQAVQDYTKAVPKIELAELVKLCAVDTELFAQEFFPKTFRQGSPPFARQVWKPLEDPTARQVELLMFRGASKTTRLRTFAAKRLSYGISRTILYVGVSQPDAIRSVTWMRHQIERNKYWAGTFGLERGDKWEETQCEIFHRTLGHTIWLVGAGINGSLRGINFDDYRPDLIIVDDPQTDESAASEDQRTKLEDLLFGAVKNSLAPETEEPNAKLVMAITPQHPEDISQKALRDPSWTTVAIPCWTPETMDLDVDQQESIWPERFTTKTLREDKHSATQRNKLSIFTKEMEVRLVARENTIFMPSWIHVRQPGIKPLGAHCVLGIDPVPPPSEREMQRGLQGKDFEAHYVWGRYQGQYHLMDCARNRGHDPSWSVATAFGFMRQYRCTHMVFDATAYQRVLKWIFEKEMQRRRIYYTVVPITTGGIPKYARITGVLSPLATNGLLHIGTEHTVFAQQWEEYGPTYAGIDDDLDASSIALQELTKPWLEEGAPSEDDLVEELELYRSCP